MSISDDAEEDHLFPWLLRVKKVLETDDRTSEFYMLLSDCIIQFKHDAHYYDDPRLLKIWLLYLESSDAKDAVIRELEDCKICSGNAMLYELFAAWCESREEWKKANYIYRLGIARNAQPLCKLKDAYSLFVNRISHRLSQIQKNAEEKDDLGGRYVNPWSISTMEELLKKITSNLVQYEGFHQSSKPFGVESLKSLQKAFKNKPIKIGSKKYQVKGCAGKGAFAQVYKAHIETNPDHVVALKVQAPPFPWEFYMYRLLDKRIPRESRSCFGFSQSMHVYSDISILVCDFYSNGTLQDVINSYVVFGKFMEEVLCIYYTAEMLYMLETLHGVGIIHGDFKPDNFLVRYSRDELEVDKYRGRVGSWGDQGLCLVDWGRGIDLAVFSNDVAFEGDCRTSGFRCVEMLENKPWKYQVDTYGLCVSAHMMLHGTYMKLQRKETADGGHVYMPAAAFKRYWNVELWKKLFSELLNAGGVDDSVGILRRLRCEFEDYLCSNGALLKQLKHLLVKKRLALCTS